MSKTLNVAIAGLGTVGAETFRSIVDQKKLIRSRSGVDVNILAVSAKEKDKKRATDNKNT